VKDDNAVEARLSAFNAMEHVIEDLRVTAVAVLVRLYFMLKLCKLGAKGKACSLRNTSTHPSDRVTRLLGTEIWGYYSEQGEATAS